MPDLATLAPRFIALDVHRQYVMVAAIDADQQVLLPPRRMAFPAFADWAPAHLCSSDHVVLEATANAWHLYDQLVPLVASVQVANPSLVKAISSAKVKTDARDTLTLARLLAGGLLPTVWIPPKEVRELRTLLAHRRRLVEWRTRARNRLHSLLHRHNLAPPPGEPFAARQRAWWLALPLSLVEQLQVRQDWALLESVAPLIAEVEAEVVRLSTVEPWAAQMPFLVQVPGIGVLTAMVLLAAIGEITRFPTAKKLVGYSGLGASIHASGQTERTGAITKAGRREMRTALVEAAWAAVASHPHWKAVFQRLSARIGKRKAIVAIARKLLVVIWHVLTDHVVDWYADREAVGRKLLRWGGRNHTATRQGLSRSAFVRRQLEVLGLGQDLEALKEGGHRGGLPPPASG
jgi:transposase